VHLLTACHRTVLTSARCHILHACGCRTGPAVLLQKRASHPLHCGRAARNPRCLAACDAYGSGYQQSAVIYVAPLG